MTDDAHKLIEKALQIKASLRTPEQARYREAVDARNRAIQRGVKQPASGTFGKAAKS
jgi:hypothetical protein